MCPEAIGDPPHTVRSEGDLDADAIQQRLTGPSREALLGRLGITGDDAAELLPLLDAAAADDEILAEVARTANLLRAETGLTVEAVDLAGLKTGHDTLQQRLVPGEGLIPILAHAVSTDTVRAWHGARGMSAQQSWRVLADLGQQLRVHRRGTGRLGLHQVAWTALNWAGRLFHLGRLQFDLHREKTGTDADRWVIGTHIPATGPLTPESVAASFEEATAFFADHFGDLGVDRDPDQPAFGREFVCESWLISAELAEMLGAESNLARFAGLWSIEDTRDGTDGAAFFVFGVRPPYDPGELPRTTRLERALAERLADGRGWRSGAGRLVR